MKESMESIMAGAHLRACDFGAHTPYVPAKSDAHVYALAAYTRLMDSLASIPDDGIEDLEF